MSFAAFKMMHLPTGIENCASGYITHSRAHYALKIPSVQSEDFGSGWVRSRDIGPIPNLIVSCANVLEVYVVRVQEEGNQETRVSVPTNRGGVMAGVSGVSLELTCHYRLNGNVESLAVLPANGADKKRDSIILTFQDAKISVLEFDDAIHGLRVSSMHCFEGPEWLHLKRGKESFASGPIAKSDPQGRCAGVLVYDLQMIILKAAQTGSGFVGEDEGFNSAVSSRVESSYFINLRDLEMKHVKDFAFIHGYIEPVMVILHERELTWAGRLPWKHHTCMLAALSISTSLKQHPLIWSAAGFPHDAYKLLAVPSPIGGALVISANAIHYHSQSSSSSLALNQFSQSSDGSQEFPRSSFSAEMDAANAAWLSDNVAMLSTKTGELLLLTLVYDGRVVQRLDLTKSRASVLTSGIATLGSSLFFLGSRLGDSLLVQFTRGMPATTSTEDIEIDDPSFKRARRSDAPHQDTDMDTDDDPEELDEGLSLFPSSVNEPTEDTLSFTVRDLLVNVGPLKDFVYGLRPNADPNAVGTAKQSNYELVCCSGHGKNGSLCVLQRSIRTELITEVELPGCRGVWTVYHKNSRGEEDEFHAYLVISLEARTMVLETADDLREVTESVDYFVQGSTIAAGNLFGRRRVVQVFTNGARVLDGSFLTQELVFGNSAAASASISDPHVMVRMSDGTVRLLTGDPATCSLTVASPFENRRVSACCLYLDRGPDHWLRRARTDAWLSTGAPSDTAGEVYRVLCYDDGTMEIHDASADAVFSARDFVSGNSRLVDRDVGTTEIGDGGGGAPPEVKAVELNMQRWSGSGFRSGEHGGPFLFAVLDDGTLLCYRAYVYDDPDSGAGPNATPRLRNLRFARVHLDDYSRVDVPVSSPVFVHFGNVGGQEGLFLTGSRPAWMMVFRERIRVHPQFCDGGIVSFAVLHNVNCDRGAIYVTGAGVLKICQLPSGMSYDSYWPVAKVPLRATPHQVTYFAESNLYPVIVSFPAARPVSQIVPSLTDTDDAEPLTEEELRRSYSVDVFEIRVMERSTAGGGFPWRTRAAIGMQAFENALTVRVVSLLNESTRETDSLLAAGTAFVQGEDVSARGRVILFSAVDGAVSEIYAKEVKGAVSAVAAIQGHLLVATGPKVVLHSWSGTELSGVAFFDAPPLHVVSLNIVKNFILLGDVHRSVYFLSRKEHGSQLNLLAKDFGSVDCLSTEFLIDGGTLSLVVSDQQKNVRVFYYAPKMTESWKGQKLLLRSEFHAGAHIAKFLRLQMLPSAGAAAAAPEKTSRFALLFGTLDGGIGCVAPLDEITYRRLHSLQKKLVETVAHVAGLNPRSFRQFRTGGKGHRPGPDTMVDCELLSHYQMLPRGKQLHIAHQIGTTRSQILSNLTDLALTTSFL